MAYLSSHMAGVLAGAAQRIGGSWDGSKSLGLVSGGWLDSSISCVESARDWLSKIAYSLLWVLTGLGWLRQLGLVTRPLHWAGLGFPAAWRSRTSWISYSVASFSQTVCSKNARQRWQGLLSPGLQKSCNNTSAEFSWPHQVNLNSLWEGTKQSCDDWE